MENCSRWFQKARGFLCLITVEPALFLISMGYGISDTATKVLQYDKVCIMILDDVDACVSRNMSSSEEILVQQTTSYWDFYRVLAYSLPAIFMNVIYANLADRWSKKYVMIFCPVGYIASAGIYLVCAIYLETSPAYLLLSSFVIGVSGSLLTMLGACFSYLSTISAAGTLIVHISIAEAAMLASSSISSFVSGVILDDVGYVYVYMIAIVAYVLLIVYVLARIKNIPPSSSAKEPDDVAMTSSVDTQEGCSSDVTCDVEYSSTTCSNVNSDVAYLDETANGVVSDTVAIINIEEPSFAFNTGNGKRETGSENGGNDYVFQKPIYDRATSTLPFASIDKNMVESACGDLSVTSDIPVADERSGPISSGQRLSCSNVFRTLVTYGRDYLQTVVKPREERKRSGIIAILIIILFDLLCSTAVAALCYLFVIQEPLSWSTTVYGFYSGSTKVIKGFCLLVILPLMKKMNVPMTVIMIISLISTVFSNTIFALSLYTWMAFLSAAVGIFHSCLIVTARAFIVNFVEEEEHGRAFGIIASVESLGVLLSSAIFNLGVYPATVDIFSGLALLIAALTLAIPLVVAIWLHVFVRKMKRLQENNLRSTSVDRS